jgi:hypothetical protein
MSKLLTTTTLMATWSSCVDAQTTGGFCGYDGNSDGTIDTGDILNVLSEFGNTCNSNDASGVASLGCSTPTPANLPRSLAGFPRTLLYASNFTRGTVRLTAPGVYVLQEDVTFDPNIAQNSWPNCGASPADPTQAPYCINGRPAGAYSLGFFAALTMEGASIHLDLNGKSISQSRRHALNQRFFAVIEMADQPFVPKPTGGSQGPANFGSSIDVCTRCTISNGVIGRSAHHGIHGNRVADARISGVVFRDYEVAAISLNGCQRCELKSLDIQGSHTRIPVRATFSAARFGLLFWDKLVAANPTTSSPGFQAVAAAASALQADANNFRSWHLTGSTLSPAARAAFAMPFAPNGQQLVDGNAYGITMHGDGVLVGAFGQNMRCSAPCSGAYAAHDILIEDVNISHTAGNVDEVVTLKGSDNKPMVDIAGSVIRWNEITTNGAYTPDALHNFRFNLAYHSDPAGGNDPVLVAAKAAGHLGTLRIGTAAATAAVAGSLTASNASGFMCNIDSMNHHQKGVIGLFIQQSERVRIKNVNVRNTTNWGALGSNLCGRYHQSIDGTGPAAGDDHLGYTGNQAYGIVVTTSSNVDMQQTTVDSVHSHTADSHGIRAFNDVDTICLSGTGSKSITTGLHDDASPNSPTAPQLLSLGGGVSGVHLTNFTAFRQGL